ncbi:arsenite oxidase, small subunit [Pyrobaculum oguniense TE7]|uniref:Arsenite oxidase, small subunit n=1 Tax=Pyrobaculum oguniense (strain DSM 13380 / JCM 10595 / TE7) TaxID=698757 RepID=H6Q794_PYROT|nr:arsenite oxidase, small subunit [Pyrobaculum oguniense TE7]
MSEQEKKMDKRPDAVRRTALVAIGGLAVGGVVGYFLAPRGVTTVTQTVTQTVAQTVTQTQTVTQAPPQPVQVTKAYERVKLANIRELSNRRPVLKQYMGLSVLLVKLGERAVGGVGPDGDVVAFVNQCTHMGGPLIYLSDVNCVVCQLHYTQFDLARGGKQVTGHATEYLPQLMLEYDEGTGDIYAVGINQLVYGKYDNLS